MARNINPRTKESYRANTKAAKKRQLKGLDPRWRENIKTGKETPVFSTKKYEKDIIKFSENEIFLPEKKEELIRLENWEKEVFSDCFYKKRPRLILISLGKKNGKSTFSAMVLNYFLITQEPGELYICSNSKEQSNFITFRKVVSMIRKNPRLDKKCRIFADYIENIKTGTILRCLSSSYRSSAGLSPLLIVIDELATFDTASLKFFFEELQLSPIYKNPLILVTSTAGREEQGLLWDLVKESEKGNTPDSYFYIKQGKEANPSSFVTDIYLKKQRNKPGMRENLFKRLHKNLWVSEEDSFITDQDYRACIDYSLIRRPEKRIPIWVGLDIGIRHDFTAICSVTKNEGKIELVDHKIYVPTKAKELDFGDVKRYILELNEIYLVKGVYFDPYQGISLAQDLRKIKIKMAEVPQTQANCIAFSQNLYDLIKSQRISFYSDEQVRESLINCKCVYSDRGWRIVKKSGKRKIDLAISTALAAHGACMTLDKSDRLGGVFFGGMKKKILAPVEQKVAKKKEFKILSKRTGGVYYKNF